MQTIKIVINKNQPPFAFFRQTDTLKNMINTVLNMIPQGSIFRKKRSWLCAALVVIGMFLFTAAKQAPKAEIIAASPEKTGIKAVVFDLGGVLFDTASSTKASLFMPIILKNPTLIYKLFRINSKKDFFNLLENIPAASTIHTYNNGQKLPLILADWMSGLKTPQEIKLLADKAIENSDFSTAEKNLFYGISQLMFTPKKLAESQTLVVPMAKLLKTFKEAGYKVYILSNWDEESFEAVCKKYPKLFNLCDQLFISGKEKLSKPNPEFFKKLLSEADLKPAECMFIDDEPNNITAAQKLGFKTIEHKTALDTCKELIKCNLIKLTPQNQ